MALTPAEYARSFDDQIGPFVSEAARRVRGFAARLRAAGVAPEDMTNTEALNRIPVLTKDEVLDHQLKEPPFGGLLARDARLRRVFQSPGPLYEPELDGLDPWRWAPALKAAGFGPEDLVLNAFGYHLTPAGAMFEQAAHALGCRVLPGGVGSQDLQVRACIDLGVTSYIGLPSYLKVLLDQLGDRNSIIRAFVAGEPLPPSLRAQLRERVSTVSQGYGTAETGNLGYECEHMSGLHVPSDALVQICDLENGKARWDGSVGQVVVTLLRPEYPLVRFGTGDLSGFVTDPCQCGRATPRLVGWLGRVGEAVKVRGMFLHPRQVGRVMAEVPEVSAYQFVIDRTDHKDVLRCEVVPASGADGGRVSAAVKERVRSGLRFDVDVSVVDVIESEGQVVDLRTWE